MLWNRRHLSMQNRTRCSAWEAQGQPAETNCIPEWNGKEDGITTRNWEVRPASHTCHQPAQTWNIITSIINFLSFPSCWCSRLSCPHPGRSLGHFPEKLNLSCMHNSTVHWLCAQPSAVQIVSLWSQVCFLTKIEMFCWKKICTEVVSHKHQSIQRRKILKAGTSGIILKLRTIFSKTGSHWDLNILQTHKSRKRGFKKIPLGIICLLKEHWKSSFRKYGLWIHSKSFSSPFKLLFPYLSRSRITQSMWLLQS